MNKSDRKKLRELIKDVAWGLLEAKRGILSNSSYVQYLEGQVDALVAVYRLLVNDK